MLNKIHSYIAYFACSHGTFRNLLRNLRVPGNPGWETLFYRMWEKNLFPVSLGGIVPTFFIRVAQSINKRSLVLSPTTLQVKRTQLSLLKSSFTNHDISIRCPNIHVGMKTISEWLRLALLANDPCHYGIWITQIHKIFSFIVPTPICAILFSIRKNY